MRFRPLNAHTSENMIALRIVFERTTEMEIIGYTVKCDTVSHFESPQPEKSGVK